MHKYLTILKNSVLATVAVCSLLIIISSAGLFGHKTYVVRSGSMKPKIGIGSLVVDTKAASYKIGDVITFHRAGFADPVTHRIAAIKKSPSGTPVYTVKGDANPVADSQTVAPGDIVGKVSYSVPYVGYLSVFIKTLPGLILLIIIPATLIIYHELLNIGREVAAIKASKNKQSRARGKTVRPMSKETTAKTVAAVFILGLAMPIILSRTSTSALTDSVVTSANTITTTTP